MNIMNIEIWGWIRSLTRNLTVIGGLILLPYLASAQVPGCKNFSIGIMEDGTSTIQVSELLRNKPEMPLRLLIRSQNFTTIYEGQVTDVNAPIKLELCQYVNKSLIFELSNSAGHCSDTLNVSYPPLSVIKGRKASVLCSDPLTSAGNLIGDTFPSFQFPCGPQPELKVKEDFQVANDCMDHDKEIQQIIYRELEGKDNWGRRFSGIDTIVVYKFPEITAHHISLDTLYNLYCGESQIIGPQIIYHHPVTGQLDTLPLLRAEPSGNRTLKFVPSQFADLCNLDIKVNQSFINNTKCEKRYQVSVEIDQDCFYADGKKPLADPPIRGLTRLERGLFRLSFNVLDVDTLAPVLTLGEQVVTTYTGSRLCEAPVVFPPISIAEDCSGIRRVQATMPGYFTVEMMQDRNGNWVPRENKMIPKDGMDYQEGDTIIENAFKVIIESSDSCDLISQDSFYIKVEDNTKPTVALLQNIRVGLTGQLTWLDVSVMDEGSTDNCGVALVLGRRTDWATAGGVNLCDGLETDARINPVEAYYANFRNNLESQSFKCSNLLYEEWMKDSMRYCQGELPDSLVAEIGGGWTTQIPFTCEDACQDIEVEILVIDNWCNWETRKSTVKVRDEQPITIVQDLKNNITMNCSSYNEYYAEVVSRAAELNNRPDTDPERIRAFNALDSLLGGYVSVWQDLDGQMTTDDGLNVIPSEHTVDIRKHTCENYTVRKSVQVFDENTGQFKSEMQNVPAIRAVAANERVENGIVAVNCSSSTYEKISVQINECGVGTIRRRFYVAGGCGDIGQGDWLNRNEDRIEYTREQIIYIEADCGLSAGMVQMPPAVSALDVCNIEKSTNGIYGGELHPDFTGWPEFTWSKDCRDLTMGYDDKLFRLFGNNPIGEWKLVRNWHISDKCAESGSGEVIHFEQIIILNELEQCDSTGNHYVMNGTITDPGGAPVRDVSIRLFSDRDEGEMARTSIQGTYSLTGEQDLSYKIIPYKNDEMMRGISTFDLVLIQKDILKIDRLDNVYKRIAADVNNNGLIEPTDMIELRKLILRPDLKFANNTSYQFRFAGSNANFAQIENLDKNVTADFVAIKIGDVNFSASEAVPTSRSSGMHLVIQDQLLRSGNSFRIPVRVASDKSVLGFQFEWDLDENDIQSISLEPGAIAITPDEYAVLDNGKLTASWFDIVERYFPKDEVLFYINITPTRLTTVRDIISPSSEILRTESYVEPGVVQPLIISFDKIKGSITSIHNRPNPFRDQTVIRFEQERSAPVDFHVLDMTGKLILEKKYYSVRGENEMTISGAELPGPGMYYYRIITTDAQWTGKMIYIQ